MIKIPKKCILIKIVWPDKGWNLWYKYRKTFVAIYATWNSINCPELYCIFKRIVYEEAYREQKESINKTINGHLANSYLKFKFYKNINDFLAEHITEVL